jgi:hypothetical protein
MGSASRFCLCLLVKTPGSWNVVLKTFMVVADLQPFNSLIEHHMNENYTHVYLPDKNRCVPSLTCVHLPQTNAHKPWILGILSVFKDFYFQTTNLLHFKYKNYSTVTNVLLEAFEVSHISGIITSYVSTGVKLTESPVIPFYRHHHYHHPSRVRPW